jgi:hypothetical protein
MTTTPNHRRSPVVPGRRYDAALHLLDRQIVDPDGRLVAKVDDLEVVERDDGRLQIATILIGPGALGPRFGGRFGDWVLAVWARLHPSEHPAPGRIPMADVIRVDSAVHVGRGRDQLIDDRLETWARVHVVERLPGHPHGD